MRVLTVFESIQQEYTDRFRREHQLRIKTGIHLGASVVKLLKDDWTLDDHHVLPATAGVFFSLWVDLAGSNRRTVMYNIHAFKLARLGDRKIKARAFANDFRKRAAKLIAAWPAVSTDHGPLTLMQGGFPLREQQLRQDCLDRMTAFTELCPTIDALLAPHLSALH